MQLISNSPHQVRKSDSTGSMTKVIYLGMSFMCHSATGVPSPKDGGKERWGGGVDEPFCTLFVVVVARQPLGSVRTHGTVF